MTIWVTSIRAIDGVNTPELQQADNDYAVGRLVDKVAQSPYKSNTLIFVVEDDAQDGADHVDAHRTTAYIVGPFVRRHAVVSQFYPTVNLLRTIEDILGLQHLNIYTATQRPMTDVFDLHQPEWTFNATPSSFLYCTQLPLPECIAPTKIPKPMHGSAYWAKKTAAFDFTKEDNLGDPERFNRIIWEGLKENLPYPSKTTGTDLRKKAGEATRNESRCSTVSYSGLHQLLRRSIRQMKMPHESLNFAAQFRNLG